MLTADVIIIATGSRPFHPPGVPFDDPDVLDSDAAALLDHPLQSLVVVGGGAVGCEFASIFTALGAEVVLVDSGPRLLPFMDAEIAELLADDLPGGMGMRVVQGAGRRVLPAPPPAVEVALASGETLAPEKVIFADRASGQHRRPRPRGGGVATDDRGRILVDEHYRTTAEGIYAAGDVIGPPALASVSMEQARVAAVLGLRPPAEADGRPAAAVRRLLGPRGRHGRPHRGGRRRAGHRPRRRAGRASRPTPAPPSPARSRAW